jgi:hypothetical protein
LCSNGVCTQRLDCAAAALPIEPAGSCPTEAATGTLLQGFDEPDAIDGWRPAPEEWGISARAPMANLSIAYDDDEGVACAGALELTIPFDAYDSIGVARLAFRSPEGEDTVSWSGKSALRASLRVADPGTRNLDYLKELVLFVSTLSADGLSTRVGVSRPFSRFSNSLWHELRVTFDREADWARVTGYGVALVAQPNAPLGGPAVPPKTTLYVDDIVLE